MTSRETTFLFTARWVLSCAIGFMAGLAPLPQILDALPHHSFIAFAVAGLLAGLATAALRLFTTPHSFQQSARWFGATAVGYALALPAAFTLALPLSHLWRSHLSSLIAGLAFGLTLGVLQRAAFPAGHRRAWIWLVASPLSWATAFFLAAQTVPSLPFTLYSAAHLAEFGALSGGIYAVLSALPLLTIASGRTEAGR